MFALLPLAKAGHTTEADGPCERWGYRDSEQTRGLTQTMRHVEGIQNFPRFQNQISQVIFPPRPDISIPFRKPPGAALCWDVDVVVLLDSHLLSGASNSRSRGGREGFLSHVLTPREAIQGGRGRAQAEWEPQHPGRLPLMGQWVECV